jgi:hypothetical protein
MMNLKTNKTFTKDPKKNRNQNNKGQIKKIICDKLRLKNKIENK